MFMINNNDPRINSLYRNILKFCVAIILLILFFYFGPGGGLLLISLPIMAPLFILYITYGAFLLAKIIIGIYNLLKYPNDNSLSTKPGIFSKDITKISSIIVIVYIAIVLIYQYLK